jgi:POT family proton-dependent oligopeptide transporter
LIRTAIQNWRMQPRELFGLCMVEIWERFGFVTTMGLMVLFLASPVAEHGLGWANADALQLLAWFAAALFTSPMLGGWLADNVLGQRRAIFLGGVLMAAGYLGLGFSPYLLSLAEGDAGVLREIVAASGLALAQVPPDPVAWNIVASRLAAADAPVAGGIEAFAVLYNAQAALIVGSLALVVSGNALFKPSVSTLVGQLYPAGDPRRDGGFTLFWTCINAGAFLAYIVGGAVSEGLGWNYGFLAASVGMLGGLAVFASIQRRLPRWVKPAKPAAGAPVEKLTPEDGKRIGAILVMTAFAVIFNANHGQILGLVGLFLLQDVDRTIGAAEVPTLWVTALNPLLILLTAPLASVVWDALGRRGRNPSFPMKFAIALLVLALGQAILTLAAIDAIGPEKAALAWVVLAMVALSLAEIPLQPIGLSMVTLLTPPRLVSMMIGVWLLNYALGGWIGGMAGALASTYGPAQIFAIGAGSCLVAAALLIMLRGRLNTWMKIPAGPAASNDRDDIVPTSLEAGGPPARLPRGV